MDKKELDLKICQKFLTEIQKGNKGYEKELDSSVDMKIHKDTSKVRIESKNSVFNVIATMNATITVITPYTVSINSEVSD